MLALVVTPGRAGSARVAKIPEMREGRGVRLHTLEVGVCGTDREIAEGVFGVPPAGSGDLVLGHEFLGQVQDDGFGFGFSAGDLVTATVRRPCGHCPACEEGSPDACDTGDYTERGITALDGFAREELIEDPAQLILVRLRSADRASSPSRPRSPRARSAAHTPSADDRSGRPGAPW